jgi:type II secretory pathway pseudopilin PulG
MRKMLIGLIVLTGMILLLQPAFGQVSDKKAELEKVRKYISLLDQKIINARNLGDQQKVIQLQGMKQKELDRAQRLKQEIEGMEMPATRRETVRESRTAAETRKGGFLVGGGYGGGAAIIKAGYAFPVGQNYDLGLNAGFGIGNEYSIVMGGAFGKILFDNFYTGIDLGFANYSETVTNIAGISGNIEKGGQFEAELFAGAQLGQIQLQAGYNTALGITATAAYKF